MYGIQGAPIPELSSGGIFSRKQDALLHAWWLDDLGQRNPEEVSN